MPAEVTVGQIWQDIDARMLGRQIIVVSLDKQKAVVRNMKTHRLTTIAIDRFKETSMGYRLLRDSTQ